MTIARLWKSRRLMLSECNGSNTISSQSWRMGTGQDARSSGHTGVKTFISRDLYKWITRTKTPLSRSHKSDKITNAAPTVSSSILIPGRLGALPCPSDHVFALTLHCCVTSVPVIKRGSPPCYVFWGYEPLCTEMPSACLSDGLNFDIWCRGERMLWCSNFFVRRPKRLFLAWVMFWI